MKLMSKVALLIAVFGVAFNVHAATEAELSAAQRAVTSVPAPEMPAKAAQVVKAAKKKDRSTVARSVIKAIAAKNRTSVLVSVSSIIKAAPETASAVAHEATLAVPDQALRIARIASIAAPEQTQAIRVSVAEVAPAAVAQKLVSRPANATVSQPTGSAAATTVAATVNSTRASAHNHPPVFFFPIIRNDPINTSNRVRLNENEGTIELANDFGDEEPETFNEDDVEIEYGARD